MDAAKAQEILERAATQLGEHFDAVQILATWSEAGVTHSIPRGAGNWYARQGMAHEFINQDVAQENAKQIADRIARPDDDGDWKGEPAN